MQRKYARRNVRNMVKTANRRMSVYLRKYHMRNWREYQEGN